MDDESKDTPVTDNCDGFLRHLVYLTNKFHLYFPITLSVSGVLISGDMIDGKSYFEEFGKMIRQGMAGFDVEFAQRMQEAFTDFGQRYDELQYKPSEEDENMTADEEEQLAKKVAEEHEKTHYVHLKDARAYYPTGSIPTQTGSIWRVRLSEVDGFLFGRLGIGNR